jgi:hypothetical protein
MSSAASVLVQDLFDSQARFAGGNPCPQVGQLRQPSLPVWILPGIRQRRQSGQRTTLANYDYVLAFLCQINEPEQIRLRLFNGRSHTLI